jgi:DUF1680 family protein
MKRCIITGFLVVMAMSCTQQQAKEEPFSDSWELQATPFTDVKIDDEFWSPRLKANQDVSIPHTFDWCEKTSRIANFRNAAACLVGEQCGKFQGLYFNDFDVYKIIEGTAYTLATERPFTGDDGKSVKVIAIKCKNVDGRELTAVPYYIWDNRAKGAMSVWVQQDGLANDPDPESSGWKTPSGEPILYRLFNENI